MYWVGFTANCTQTEGLDVVSHSLSCTLSVKPANAFTPGSFDCYFQTRLASSLMTDDVICFQFGQIIIDEATLVPLP